MINNVRRTVLAILNKSNYGYISPDDFNNYARVAQLEVFENYVHQFNKENNKINSRMAGSGHADNRARYNGELDKFIALDNPTSATGDNAFTLPSLSTNGDDIFKIVSVSTAAAEAQKVSNTEFRRLNMSDLTAPALWSPIYTVNGNTLTMGAGNATAYTDAEVNIEYLRYPRIPNWTYMSLGGGEPLFDATANDFQDFEVGIAEETELINKILQMAGMSIREIQSVQAASTEEVERKTEQK